MEAGLRRILLASAAIVALGGSALAAELPTVVIAPAPVLEPAEPAVTWNGVYVGVFGGYGFGRTLVTTANPPGVFNGFDDALTGLTMPLNPRGLFGGVSIGYNHQSGALVFGVQADAGYLNLSDTVRNTDGLPGGENNGVLDDDFGAVAYGWYGTLAARLGVAMDRTMVFATAGGILTQYSGFYADLDGAAPGTVDPFDATTLGGPQYGYLVGAGAEFAFDANWTAKLEYNYVDLGNSTTGNLDGDTFTHRNNAHLIKFGLNYLFDY